MTTPSELFAAPEAAALFKRVQARSEVMKHHRVFGLIDSMDKLRTFMSWHAFAVWDFMSLTKRLQMEYTTLTLPWVPARSAATARLINEIVLGEETDEAPGGRHLSHYELYLGAMQEVGASVRQIAQFVDLVATKTPVSDALSIVGAPAAVRDFVLYTLSVATRGSIEDVLGSFVFGREDVIPEMFQSLLKAWQIDESEAPTFVFYLQRHIQLDGEEHGPASMRMLAEQVDGDAGRLKTVLETAIAAIDQRIKLWDGLAESLEKAPAALAVA